MRTILLSVFICLSVWGYSQSDTDLHKQNDSVTLQQSLDSTNEYLKELRNKEWEDRNLAGIKLLMEQQKERRAKEKRTAMIRIGIGVVFLVIMIVGLRRKTVGRRRLAEGEAKKTA